MSFRTPRRRSLHLLRRFGMTGLSFRAKRRNLLLAAVALLLLAWFFCLPRHLFKDVCYSSVVESAEGELLGARIAADQQWQKFILKNFEKLLRLGYVRSNKFDGQSLVLQSFGCNTSCRFVIQSGKDFQYSPLFIPACTRFRSFFFFKANFLSLPSYRFNKP